MGKEQEIAKLLSQGTPPVELIQRGFARATVYKVNRRLAQERTPTPGDSASSVPGAADSVTDMTLEADPEILELKKALRMAQLERQLAEIKAPIDLEARLVRLEEHVAALLEAVDNLIEDVKGSPLMSIRQRFKCSCGNGGLVAVRVHCTACGSETRCDWFPDEAS